MVDVRVPIIEMPKQPPKEDRNTRKLDTETAERVQKGNLVALWLKKRIQSVQWNIAINCEWTHNR